MVCAISRPPSGSRLKCGLPAGCSSPLARLRSVGTSLGVTLSDTSIYPIFPFRILGLRASLTNAGIQECSYSSPITTKTCARFNLGTNEGLMGTPCGSSTPFARLSTVMRSPPTRAAMSARSGKVVTM